MSLADVIAAFQNMRFALVAAGIPDDENLHALAGVLLLGQIIASIKVVLT